MHRVEVLRSGRTDQFEFWTNPTGTVYLCLENGRDEWQAIVDGDVIIDHTNPWADEDYTHRVKPLTAPGVSGLVPLLALQERIHLILDHQSVSETAQDPLTA